MIKNISVTHTDRSRVRGATPRSSMAPEVKPVQQRKHLYPIGARKLEPSPSIERSSGLQSENQRASQEAPLAPKGSLQQLFKRDPSKQASLTTLPGAKDRK